MTDHQVIKHTLNYRQTCYMLETVTLSKKSVNKRGCRIENLKVSHQRRNVTGSEVMEMQGRGF